jgi:hypothetical protein
MLISFIGFSTFLGLWLSFYWSGNGALNCLIKAVFSLWTAWGAFMLLAALVPLVQNGQIKVF